MTRLKELRARDVAVVHDRQLERLVTSVRIEPTPKPPHLELRRIPPREPYAFD